MKINLVFICDENPQKYIQRYSNLTLHIRIPRSRRLETQASSAAQQQRKDYVLPSLVSVKKDVCEFLVKCVR